MTEQTYGWTGSILRVDLTDQRFSMTSTLDYGKRFVGGRGIQQWILFNELATEVGALDPSNLLIFGTGPLTGTEAPASCYTAISAKNVFTGGTNFSHVGGYFAPQLKFAGFDHVVISGRAAKPVYLWLHDGEAELRNASHLWGKTTWETEKIIKEELGDENIRVASIGPAGENLVRPAAIIVDQTRAAGGGGIGTVMGSKNLKAVAARGNGQVKIARPDEFNRAVSAAMAKINSSRATKILGGRGTHGAMVRRMNELCWMPVRNVEDDHWDPEKAERIGLAAIEKYKTKETTASCFNCPIGCGNHFYHIDEGPYAGVKIRVFEASTGGSFGSRLDIDYAPALFKAYELLSQLGLDESDTGVVVSWAFDCYQRGILTKEDTGGRELQWGDHETALELIRNIAHREGLGDLLAEGVKLASEKIGKGSEYYAIHVKGQDFTDAIRAAKGWALGIITATRGGRHLNGAPQTEYLKVSPEVGEEMCGVPTAGDPLSYEGKGKLVFWQEQFKAVVDMVGLCYFTSQWVHPNLLATEDYARMVSAATGIDFSAEELMLIGRRVHNVEKAINTLHAGFTRHHDLPPRILMEQPIRSGEMEGELLDKKRWEGMLDEYYFMHGWDRETGWQTKETLQELDLDEVAQRLEEVGRLK